MAGLAARRLMPGPCAACRSARAAVLRAVVLATVLLLAAAAPQQRRLLDWLNSQPGSRSVGVTVTRLSGAQIMVTTTESITTITSAGVTPIEEVAPITEVAPQRPLTIFFLAGEIDRTAAVRSHLLDRVLPAANRVLAKSIRIRSPSGPLDFSGVSDRENEPIPEPTTLGQPAEGFDADLVVKVKALPLATCAGRFTARAGALQIEDGTNRPILGDIDFCELDPAQFQFDLTTSVHELLHILGVAASLFPFYLGYPEGFPSSTGASGGRIIESPNVQVTSRAFFGCEALPGASFEDDGARGGRDTHWEERIFDGVVVDTSRTQRVLQTHFNQAVLTDITLSLLQDSNWYDVKYGSAGFNAYGYKGGCAFANGTAAQALADPAAAQYLCPAAQEDTVGCVYDSSGVGECTGRTRLDGFFRFEEGPNLEDCQGGARGSRCVASAAGGATCQAVSCSAAGDVLIDGAPCDSSVFACPNATVLCGEPGYLSCAAHLNDCSGNGDCFQGHCFCHPGFGGDDCSVPVCINGCGTDQADPCPPSGFCGVPLCGAFSNGTLDRGTPCNSGAAPAKSPVPAHQPKTPSPPPPSIKSSSSGGPVNILRDSTSSVTISSSESQTGAAIPPIPPAPATPTAARVVVVTAPTASAPPVAGCGGLTCVRDNRQCAGSGFPVSRPCCSASYNCVKRSDTFSQCRSARSAGIATWDGSILQCGTAT